MKPNELKSYERVKEDIISAAVLAADRVILDMCEVSPEVLNLKGMCKR